MNNLNKFIELLDNLINQLGQFKNQIPFGNPTRLENDLSRELEKARYIYKFNKGEYKYEYYSGEILHTKSPNGEMYEFIGSRNSEIRNIQNQIDELILPIIQSKHASMKTEFEKLRINAKSKLPEIGFQLKDEDNFTSEFRKHNDLKVKIVDQRYDPPECWISIGDKIQYIRIGFITEYYFDDKLTILKKYVNNEGLEFDHSSIAYYLDFLKLYEEKLLNIDDFVTTINEWSKSNYLSIEKIKNAI